MLALSHHIHRTNGPLRVLQMEMVITHIIATCAKLGSSVKHAKCILSELGVTLYHPLPWCLPHIITNSMSTLRSIKKKCYSNLQIQYYKLVYIK